MSSKESHSKPSLKGKPLDRGKEREREEVKAQRIGLQYTRWRVSRVEKQQKRKRILIILRGYARMEEKGKLKRVEMRVMVDTGAEGDFISPSLAQKLGGKDVVEQGKFGVAVEAFGGRTQLTQRVPRLRVDLPGEHPHSLLAQEFTSHWDFIVAPKELGEEYDMLVGMKFARRFGLGFDVGKTGQVTLRLTARDGLTTLLREERELDSDSDEEEKEESSGDPEEANTRTNTVKRRKEKEWELDEERVSEPYDPKLASWVAKISTILSVAPKPLSGSQRRKMRSEWNGGEQERIRLSTLAVSEVPEIVMSTQQLEEEWRTAKPGTIKVHTIWYRGLVQDTQEVKVNGVQSDKGEEEDGTLLPLEERLHAEKMVKRLTKKEFPHVFPDELPKLSGPPPDRGMPPFEIKLKADTQPMGRYGARMTEENTREAEKMIRELLEKGFIRPSKSPWGCPMFLVDKPDGSKRMVIDYRALNSATERNRYPLPRVDELFDQLQGARYFSKIDLRTGYWQIRIAPEDIPKTAFTSRHGHFEWLVLPMGLTNAPAEFMALMENTFREALNKYVLVFLDDILIYSKTLEEHEQHLRAVLKRLADQQLYGKLSKCQFARQEVEFFGHYVGRRGIRMVEGKVTAVEKWPKPACQKDVEMFLGLAGYYRRFILNFSKIASPLSELCGTLSKCKKGATKKPPKKLFVWGKEQQHAFESLKEAVTRAPCLAIPDPKKDFIVHTDASGYATGAVLMQKFEEGFRPIAFLSKKMGKAERNYPVHEQELLAILNALKAWRHYLGGRPFTILTDHQSLQYVESSAMATPRQMRWATWLSEFEFSIKYVPGIVNTVADALSRGAAGGKDGAEQRETTIDLNQETDHTGGRRLLLSSIRELAPLPVRVREAAERDEEYQSKLEKSHEELKEMKMSKGGGLLYRMTEDHTGGQLVIPSDQRLQTYLLDAAHDVCGAHNGIERTTKWLKERVWWERMNGSVEKYVKGCESCQRNKPNSRAGHMGLPMSIERPERAWDCITMDFIGPFPKTARGYDSVLVIVERVTRWVYYIPVRTTNTAQEVFAVLNARVLANHGIPSSIISDRDSRFTSHFWEGVWSQMGTALKRSTAFHPQTDGQSERQVRTVVEAMRAYIDAGQGNWDIILPQLQFAHNTSVSASTGMSPYEMMYGRTARTPLDAELEADGVALRGIYPGAKQLSERIKEAESRAREITEKAQAHQRQQSMRGRSAVTVKEGDLVWLANKNMKLDSNNRARKLEPLFFGPYKIISMKGSNAATLALPEGCRLHPTFNVDLLRKYVDGRVEFPERIVSNARPGPIPEEDPNAGGPGDPIYEAEEIIGERKRNGVQQYRIKWVGWPIEQSSWVNELDCTDCLELIEDYRQRLSTLHAAQARLAMVRAEEELRRRKRPGLGKAFKRLPDQEIETESEVETERRGPTDEEYEHKYDVPEDIEAIDIDSESEEVWQGPQTQTETAREIARRAESDTKPVLPGIYLPPVGKDGSIQMGSQRCIADTAKGIQCSQRTRHGAHCWIHLAQKFGVRIKNSTLGSAAGKGLFAAKDYKRNEVVARYTGDLIPSTSGDDLVDNKESSHYRLLLSEVGQGAIIDAARTNAAEGRMVNDARGSGKKNNCKFSCNQVKKTAVLRAVRRIMKGEELFVNYGPSFWPTGNSNVKPSKERVPAVAEATVPLQRKEKNGVKASWAEVVRGEMSRGSKEEPIEINTSHLELLGSFLKSEKAKRSARKVSFEDSVGG